MSQSHSEFGKAILILTSGQIAQTVADWSVTCAEKLFKDIGEATVSVSQEFVDVVLHFAIFFFYSFNLALFRRLGEEQYREVRVRSIEIFSQTFVEVFYKESKDSQSDGKEKYAEKIATSVQSQISLYVKAIMAAEHEKRFSMSIAMLSYNISQTLHRDLKSLSEKVLNIVMKAMDKKKMDALISTAVRET